MTLGTTLSTILVSINITLDSLERSTFKMFEKTTSGILMSLTTNSR